MINRFQAANPDINIVYQYFPYEVLISKLQAGYNSGTVADMQQMFGTWVTQYAGFGLLDPVPANLSEGMADRFFEAAIGAYGLNGQYYGMPKEYNLENGSHAGQSGAPRGGRGNRTPATWQELMDNAVKATKYDDQNRITQAGFLMAGNDAITFLFLAMILQQGATYWADDGVHVNFQTDAAKKAWQDETDIVTKYHVEDETSLPTSDRYVVFFQGKGAMCMRRPLGDRGRSGRLPGSGFRLRQPCRRTRAPNTASPPSRAGARSSTPTPRPRTRKPPGSSSTSWPSRTICATGTWPPTPSRP